MNTRIPPINCLITFETLANLRSVTKTADALGSMPFCVELDLSNNGEARRHREARQAPRGWLASA